MINPNPNCEKECRFSSRGIVSTCLGWTPIYDKRGKQINSDPNTHSETIYCSVCKESWIIITKNGKISIEKKLL